MNESALDLREQARKYRKQAMATHDDLVRKLMIDIADEMDDLATERIGRPLAVGGPRRE